MGPFRADMTALALLGPRCGTFGAAFETMPVTGAGTPLTAVVSGLVGAVAVLGAIGPGEAYFGTADG